VREKEQGCSVSIPAHFAFILASLSQRDTFSRKDPDRGEGKRGGKEEREVERRKKREMREKKREMREKRESEGGRERKRKN